METEFSLSSRPTTNVMAGASLLIAGALAPLGGLDAFLDPGISPTVVLLVCWAAAFIFLAKKRSMSASLSSNEATVYIRIDNRRWSYAVDSIDYIAIRNKDPDVPADLVIVFKNQVEERLLDSDPVEEFGFRLAQLMNIHWSRE